MVVVDTDLARGDPVLARVSNSNGWIYIGSQGKTFSDKNISREQ